MTDTMPATTVDTRLARDLRDSAALMTRDQARFLVDTYYQIQKIRIETGNQQSSLRTSEEPHALVGYFTDQLGLVESQIKKALGEYAKSLHMGRWAQSICGIGPVLSAGLLAYIDMDKAAHPASIWRYGGMDPSLTWNKGEKCPWNPQFKTFCWKIGESFVKVQSRENDIYGQLFKRKKESEAFRNENGGMAQQATNILEGRRCPKPGTEARATLESGKLFPAVLNARAKRWVVKLFLSHWWEEAWCERNPGLAPPDPYPMAELGHDMGSKIPRPLFIEE